MNEPPLPEAPESLPQEYLADVGFEDLNLSPELSRAIKDRGYTHPTPVQARAFKPVVEGRDLIVRSKTGTGKTAAFGMPLIERIPMGTREVKALVLCPTRELALQVAQELEALSRYRDIAVTAIYGGASMKQQEDALRAGSAIIVGTPGRVHDHIRRGNLKLGTAAFAVLDEADEMLDQGFYEEVTRILDCLPSTRQVLLFSATVPADIQRLIAKYTTNAETLLLSGDVYTVDHITHVRYELSDAFPKPRNLLYMLEMEDPENAIIFCNTRTDTELVTAVLNRNGFDAELLNGDLPQKERERVMAKIKRGEVAFMVATDLAARGIDISDLGHVINYSLPEDPAVYLHRVGRTGRIGKTGVALNLTSGRELATLSALEKKYNITFERRQMLTPEEALKQWVERHVRELKDAAMGSIYEAYLGLAGELKRRPDADELIAFMLKYFFSHRRMERAQVGGEAPAAEAPTEERPARHERGPRRDRGEREPRDEAPREAGGPTPSAPRPAAPTSGALSDRELFAQHQATQPEAPPPAPAAPPTAAAPKAAPAAKRGPTDREIFEAMQAGRPIEIPADTTPSGSEVVGDDRPPRERRERGERGERPRHERGERRPREERGERRPREERSERPPREEQAPAAKADRLDDKELVEALATGKPLPLVDDPTLPPPDAGTPGRRRRRERRPAGEDLPVEPGRVRLWVNLGKVDHLDEPGLGEALESLGAPHGAVKATELRGSYAYLHVDEGDAAGFEALNGKSHGDKAVRIERAKR